MIVKQYPNSIGYVELIYAVQNSLAVASVQNTSGNFVRPSLNSITAAAVDAGSQPPASLTASITNAAGPDAYPISSITYFLVDKIQTSKVKGKVLVDYLWWAIHEGQQLAAELNYAPSADGNNPERGTANKIGPSQRQTAFRRRVEIAKERHRPGRFGATTVENSCVASA